MCSPHSPPDAAVKRARRLGPKNHAVRMYQAALANTHWRNLRVRLAGDEERRRTNAAVVHAQDHFRKTTLRRLRLDAKGCVAARGWGRDVRRGSDVSRYVAFCRE
jgi:hypothetical protein